MLPGSSTTTLITLSAVVKEGQIQFLFLIQAFLFYSHLFKAQAFSVI
jgi:hypothetical protein